MDILKGSETTLNRKRGENEHQGIDESPNEGYPRGHAEVASRIDGSDPANTSQRLEFNGSSVTK